MASVWQHLKQQWSRESGGRIWSSTPLMTEALPRASPEESGFHPGAQSEEIGDKNVRYLRRNGNLHLRTSKNMFYVYCDLQQRVKVTEQDSGLPTNRASSGRSQLSFCCKFATRRFFLGFAHVLQHAGESCGDDDELLMLGDFTRPTVSVQGEGSRC
jgi:hypothetical protein